MKNLKFIGIIIMIIGFSGCNKSPKVDSSSKESLANSLDMIMENLDEDGKKEFVEGMAIIVQAEMIEYGHAHGPIDQAAFERRITEHIDGKDAKEIIKLAKKIQENPSSHNHDHDH